MEFRRVLFRSFDPELLRRQSYVNISSVVRTDLAQQVGFKFVRNSQDGGSYDDHGFYLGPLDSGAKFAHVHEETFIWHHHGMNTSGQPNKGDAARSEEHTSELKSLMRISYAVFCLKQKNNYDIYQHILIHKYTS